jgi:formimidoylglutamate deiminase
LADAAPQSSAPRTAALHADHALTPSGWARDVRVVIAQGRIVSVATQAQARTGDLRLSRRALLPAPANLHSHAFQRAMAGMTARRGPRGDSFWTWRDLMYRFLALLTPEHVEAVAAMAQMEMLEAGYAACGEFHYLHHRPGGAPYDDRAELSARIAAAAAESGIGLTLLPTLYSHGGAGGRPVAAEQARFANDLDGFATIMGGAARAIAALPADAGLGVAPHSLRATTPEQLRGLAQGWPGAPLHIHAAEQRAEVAQTQAWLGARPVAFLLDAIGVDSRWCLIHCTHMTADETRRLAASGAVAGLCPITEADLGDGVFRGARFREAGGRMGVGSDSNIRIALADEVRILEYGQRLTRRARNVLADPGGSVGETLYGAALAGGAQALGRASGALEAGRLADLAAIDVEDVALAPLRPEQWLDGWVFAAGDRVVRDVWAAGRHLVTEGRHICRAAIEARHRAAMGALSATL